MKLKTASQWRIEFPGHRALILMPVGRGEVSVSFLLRTEEEAPEGLYRMLGFV